MPTNEKSTPLTDAEIKKALECCPQDNPNHNCARCAYRQKEGYCFEYLMKDALDLINRQQAEIERLQNECFCIANERDAIKDCINTAVDEAKAKAIKEFAERLKKQSFTALHHKMVLSNDIDNLVKEMEREINE